MSAKFPRGGGSKPILSHPSMWSMKTRFPSTPGLLLMQLLAWDSDHVNDQQGNIPLEFEMFNVMFMYVNTDTCAKCVKQLFCFIQYKGRFLHEL